MKLYNSKRNTIETFKPIEEGKVMFYLCGPTVYNYAHIGNARPLVVFDTMRRVLKASGYEVDYISNYTDIDDRIIAKAIEERVDVGVVTKRYIDAYERLKTDLNISGINKTPKATEVMDEIIQYVQELIDKEYAYEVDGDVYFRIHKIKDYGEISSQNIESLQVGARIEENSSKESPLDFALWKKTEIGKKWDSPWSEGRPGWHSECVVMIHDYFKKDLIDIHAGGFDLKFPHHENESAQNKASCGHDLANYWAHNAMINVDGEKMSKSLGNVVWAQDYVDTLGGNLTRWILLSTHYRLTMDITDALISQSTKELNKIEAALKQAHIQLQLESYPSNDMDEESYQAFLKNMQDDLNIANAQMELYEVIKKLNQTLRQKPVNYTEVSMLNNSAIAMLEILGISFDLPKLNDEDRSEYQAWMSAKEIKDFVSADKHRAYLMERGIL